LSAPRAEPEQPVPAQAAARPLWKQILLNPRMLICVFLGLASGMPLYVLNPSSVRSDSELLSRVHSHVQDRSVLLIEDIDAFSFSHDREARAGGDQDRLTLSGLLNALDGVATPHGLLVFVSSNHPDTLDPALVRTGRLDVHLELGYVDRGQVTELLRNAYGIDVDIDVPHGAQVPPSDIVEVIKQNFWDPAAGIGACRDLIELAALKTPALAAAAARTEE